MRSVEKGVREVADKKMVYQCLECGGEMIGHCDGLHCDKCGGPIVPTREAKNILVMPRKSKASKLQVRVGIMQCSKCETLNIAMRIMEALRWRNGPKASCESILRFDNEAREIIVDEPGLLRLIQLANPAQEKRRIRLEGGEKD